VLVVVWLLVILRMEIPVMMRIMVWSLISLNHFCYYLCLMVILRMGFW